MQCLFFFFFWNSYICSEQEEFIGSGRDERVLSSSLRKGLEILRRGERQYCMDIEYCASIFRVYMLIVMSVT